MALITATEVISTLAWDNMTNEAMLTPFITQAEVMHILPFLGKTFYKTLETEIAGSSLSAANEYVWETWLKSACAYAVAYVAFPQMINKVGNAGIMALNGGDYAGSASMKAVEYQHTSLQNFLGQMKVAADAWMSHADNADNFEDYIEHRGEKGEKPGAGYFGYMRPQKRIII